MNKFIGLPTKEILNNIKHLSEEVFQKHQFVILTVDFHSHHVFSTITNKNIEDNISEAVKNYCKESFETFLFKLEKFEYIVIKAGFNEEYKFLTEELMALEKLSNSSLKIPTTLKITTSSTFKYLSIFCHE